MKDDSTVVADAISAKKHTARNDAYTGFGLFKDFKLEAVVELSALLGEINKCGLALKDGAAQSKRGTEKRSERDCIDTCLAKCLAALKDAYDRISRQTKNVMA